MLEKFLRMSALLDFYGTLLTEKQRRCLEMHFLEDLSLSEIGDQLHVSRQAVYDIIHRASQLLEEYERKLGFVQRYEAQRQALEEILQIARQCVKKNAHCEEARRIKRGLEELIGKSGEARHDF